MQIQVVGLDRGGQFNPRDIDGPRTLECTPNEARMTRKSGGICDRGIQYYTNDRIGDFVVSLAVGHGQAMPAGVMANGVENAHLQGIDGVRVRAGRAFDGGVRSCGPTLSRRCQDRY